MSTDRDRLAPGKLWSVWDLMREFEAYRFLALANVLGNIAALAPEHDEPVSADWKAANLEAISAYGPVLLDLGMDASHTSLQRLIDMLNMEGVMFSDLVAISHELQGRLQDQSQSRFFFALTQRESELVANAHSGWEAALKRFPEIYYDVREAAVCLALFRHPASVYHSVQITERGLIELGKFIGVNDPISGWTAVTNRLDKILNTKYKERTEFERSNYANLEQIKATVEALKNAWRNKIAHTEGRLILKVNDFGSERAEEILMATRAFMRRLAEDIPPLEGERGEHKLSDIDDINPDAFSQKPVA